MKPLHTLLLCVSFLLLNCSDKKEDYPNYIPPATQIGANTAGCYVDGKLWIMRGTSNSDIQAAKIIPIKNYSQFGLFMKDNFFMETSDKTYKGSNILITINTKEVIEGKTYTLGKFKDDEISASGGIFMSIIGASFFFSGRTNDTHKGELTITKLVTTGAKPFVSGTFAFTAEHNGKIVKVTDGRFDLELNKILQ